MSFESAWGLEVFSSSVPEVVGVNEGHNYDNISASEASVELKNFLVHLKDSGKPVSAKAVCVLCYWITRSVPGAFSEDDDIAKLAQPPIGMQSGKYSLHYDSVIMGRRPKDRNWYVVEAPIFRRCVGERIVSPVAVTPPHEVVSENIELHGREVIAPFQRARDNLELPQSYYQHPVVLQNAGKLVFSFGIYTDAVDFTRQDSTVCIWLVDVFSKQRWSLVVLRVSELCQCGCKGNCTFHPFWVMLAWSFACLKTGKHPSTRHDSSAHLDARRAELAEQHLEALGACICFKSDWVEWGKVGFRSWAHLTDPCAICGCDVEDIYNIDGEVSRDSFPFPLKSFADYDNACKKQEIRIALTDENWRMVRSALVFAGKGRTLGINLEHLALRKGDALMPSTTLLDIGAGFDRANPGIVVFWRPSKASAVKFRCFFFLEEIGCEPHRILGPDWLHSFSLGILPWWNGWVIWELVNTDVWHCRVSGQDLVTASVRKMRGELNAWYTSEHRAGNDWTRVQDIKIGMIGSNDHRMLKLYGAEANGFLHFTGHLLEKYGHVLGDRFPRAQAGQRALADCHRLLRKHELRMPLRDADLLCVAVNVIWRTFSELEIHQVPKLHMLAHLSYHAYHLGAPAVWACWFDEALNQSLKRIGQAAHASVWAERVLETLNAQLHRLAWPSNRGTKRARSIAPELEP